MGTIVVVSFFILVGYLVTLFVNYKLAKAKNEGVKVEKVNSDSCNVKP